MSKSKSAGYSGKTRGSETVSAPPGTGLAQLAALHLPLDVTWPTLGLGAPAALRWSQAHDSAIQRDDQGEVWHAGHANAVVPYGPAILVGSDTSGVWLINPAFDAIPQRNAFPAEPLSWTWPNPQITAMCPLTDAPTACFAASSGGPGSPLRLLSLKAVLGGIEHTDTTTIPVPWWMWSLNAVLVLRGIRTVVIGGSGGVAFSSIPAIRPTSIELQPGIPPATGLPPGWVSGLAEEPRHRRSSRPSMATGRRQRVPRLVLWRHRTGPAADARAEGGHAAHRCGHGAHVGGHLRERNRSIGYAIAADSSGAVAALMRTTDGGASWASLPVPTDAGNQGFYNNCIDVHPSDPATVAFGWRGGPFVSQNSGASSINQNQDPMHSDVHGVTFTSTPSGVEIWSVRDGGVFRSTDLGATWDSRWNRHLLNLEFYNGQGAFGVLARCCCLRRRRMAPAPEQGNGGRRRQ